MSLIPFTGSMPLHVIVVWLYHQYKHRQPNTPLWCGLFCPRKPKPTRPNSRPEAGPSYSDALGPMNVLAPDYSARVRAPTRAPSMVNLSEAINSALATC